MNGTLFFTANDATTGRELWKSDGTAAGTVLVKDINPGSDSSGPSYLTNVNGTLFFTADDGTGVEALEERRHRRRHCTRREPLSQITHERQWHADLHGR